VEEEAALGKGAMVRASGGLVWLLGYNCARHTAQLEEPSQPNPRSCKHCSLASCQAICGVWWCTPWCVGCRQAAAGGSRESGPGCHRSDPQQHPCNAAGDCRNKGDRAAEAVYRRLGCHCNDTESAGDGSAVSKASASAYRAASVYECSGWLLLLLRCLPATPPCTLLCSQQLHRYTIQPTSQPAAAASSHLCPGGLPPQAPPVLAV
jgi:hypothetical protein